MNQSMNQSIHIFIHLHRCLCTGVSLKTTSMMIFSWWQNNGRNLFLSPMLNVLSYHLESEQLLVSCLHDPHDMLEASIDVTAEGTVLFSTDPLVEISRTM